MKKQDYNSQFGTITCPYRKSEFAYNKSEDIEVIDNKYNIYIVFVVKNLQLLYKIASHISLIGKTSRNTNNGLIPLCDTIYQFVIHFDKFLK